MKWGFQLKSLREALELAGFDKPLKIAIILDGGMRVDLGGYRPVTTSPPPAAGQQPETKADAPPDGLWSSIPNLVEVESDVRVTPGMLYRVMFMNSEGKKKASIMVRVFTL